MDRRLSYLRRVTRFLVVGATFDVFPFPRPAVPLASKPNHSTNHPSIHQQLQRQGTTSKIQGNRTPALLTIFRSKKSNCRPVHTNDGGLPSCYHILSTRCRRFFRQLSFLRQVSSVAASVGLQDPDVRLAGAPGLGAPTLIAHCPKVLLLSSLSYSREPEARVPEEKCPNSWTPRDAMVVSLTEKPPRVVINLSR